MPVRRDSPGRCRRAGRYALAGLVADVPTRDNTGDRSPLPDLPHVLRALRKKHVTMQLLWAEYRTAHPEGYGYTQFCHYVNAKWGQRQRRSRPAEDSGYELEDKWLTGARWLRVTAATLLTGALVGRREAGKAESRTVKA